MVIGRTSFERIIFMRMACLYCTYDFHFVSQNPTYMWIVVYSFRRLVYQYDGNCCEALSCGSILGIQIDYVITHGNIRRARASGCCTYPICISIIRPRNSVPHSKNNISKGARLYRVWWYKCRTKHSHNEISCAHIRTCVRSQTLKSVKAVCE